MISIKSQLKSLFFLLITIFTTNCTSQTADTIFMGGNIYTVNENKGKMEAVAIKDGQIMYAGTTEEATKLKGSKTQVIDLNGKTMIPGFIDSHGHFMGMGYSKLILDLTQVETYAEIITMVEEAVEKAKPGEWIIGRGWHQDKWNDSKEGFLYGFPTHEELSAVSPKNPVVLRHASGHSELVNEKAMELAGISKSSLNEMKKNLSGGEIMSDENGNPTGILNESAMQLVGSKMPSDNDPKMAYKIIDLALQECRKNGVTGFHDAGTGQSAIDLYNEYKNKGKLTVRMHVMLRNDSTLLNNWFENGPVIDSVDHLLNVRSIKLVSDGALGNRGAWLLEDYSDKAGWRGLETTPVEQMQQVALDALQYGFQVGTHAIGDRGNKEVLDIYEKAFKAYPQKKDPRFRIEHAQHLNLEDIPRFAELGVIASMQTIHMASDRPWAIDRLGEKRIEEGAYVWQKLLKTGAMIINGTDVPVEPINPLAGFYAAITRKTLKGLPEGGYEAEQKMSRDEALKSYTLSGAYGSFEEDIKGTIEKGKLADFAILDKDIMTIPEEDILLTKVVMTVLGGEVIYSAE